MTLPQAEQEVDKLVLSIDVVSAMRLLNPVNEMEPPNSFVRFRPPQLMERVLSEDSDFQTNIVNASCYPNWQSRNHKVIIPLTKTNLDHIMNGTQLLEFDVMHSQFEGYQQTQPTITLIGTAFVDFSALALDTSQKDNVISGYFHVINRGVEVRSSKDLAFMETNAMSRQSKGQLRVTVRAESDKEGNALRSTILFPDGAERRVNQSQTLGVMATSQETFGNRLNAPQVYQSLNLSGPRASATSSAAMHAPDKSAGDDEFDVDREQPREEKKFDAINESQTLTTINE